MTHMPAAAFLPRSRENVALKKTVRQGRRGINVAGAEFSASTVVWENAASFPFLAARGHRLIRLPFLWESIQPTLSGPLAPVVLSGLHATVDAAGAAGLSVVLDVHNYAAYGGVSYGAGGSFTQADFVDLWRRLSLEFGTDLTVVGYGLMNEPRNLPGGPLPWQQAQQAALTAIRNNDDSTCVMVGGYGSSNLGGWLNSAYSQALPWITDPAQNFRYEAHHYWDTNGLGTYPNTYAAEVTAIGGGGDPLAAKIMADLTRWIGWLRTYGQKGYLGEFGWPSTASTDATSAASWDALAAQYLTRMDQEGDLLWSTAWATGSRWSAGYALKFYDPSAAGILSTARSNAATLEAHGEHGVQGHSSGVPAAWPAFSFSSGSSVFPMAPVGTSTNAALGNNVLRAVPFYLPSALTVARIGVEVTAAGEAGSTVRLGIYTDTGTGMPGTLITDAGTVSGATAASAEATLSTPITLGPGWYWGAAAIQAAPTTVPTLRTTGGVATPGFLFTAGVGVPIANAGAVGYQVTAVSGALPTSFPSLAAGTTGAGSAPRLWLRTA